MSFWGATLKTDVILPGCSLDTTDAAACSLGKKQQLGTWALATQTGPPWSFQIIQVLGAPSGGSDSVGGSGVGPEHLY